MDPEIVESPVHYPDGETLARTQVFVNLPEETSRLMSLSRTHWARLPVRQDFNLRGSPGDPPERFSES